MEHGSRSRTFAQDGEIVAVQAVPGSSRIVRLFPLTENEFIRSQRVSAARSVDRAAVVTRWSATSQRCESAPAYCRRIVVLDTVQSAYGVAASSRAILSSPSWSSDGTTILFDFERLGRDGSVSRVRILDRCSAPLTNSSTGFFDPVDLAKGRLARRSDVPIRWIPCRRGAALARRRSSRAARYVAAKSPRAGCANCSMQLASRAASLDQRCLPAKRYSPWRLTCADLLGTSDRRLDECRNDIRRGDERIRHHRAAQLLRSRRCTTRSITMPKVSHRIATPDSDSHSSISPRSRLGIISTFSADRKSRRAVAAGSRRRR